MKKAYFLSLFIFLLIGSTYAQNGTVEATEGVLLGNSTTTTDGVIRYTGADIEGRIGGSWTSLTGGSGSSIWNQSGSDIYFNSGDVGIGTDSPIRPLHIFGGTGSSTGLPNALVRQYIEDDTQVFSEINATTWAGFTFHGQNQSLRAGMYYNYASDDLRFKSGGVNGRLTIDPNGYVGIGTVTPAKHLDLAASGADIRFSNSNFSALQWYEGATEVAYLTHNGDNVIFQNSDTGYLEIEAENDDLVLKAGGNVQVGDNVAEPTVIMTEVGTGATKYSIFEMTNYNNTGSDKSSIYAHTQGSANEPYIILYNSDGTEAIKLDADVSGDSRIITDELEIKGGSDFAEHFDINTTNMEIETGMVVSIDPSKAGQLKISDQAYDKKVAGIISGANGVETGVMMGQKGSIADGDYAIALSGRVFVYTNRESGEIQPGDFLTSSSTPGFAMKANDDQKSRGSIIGKAMTPIDENGFVLVLVNLQ